MRRWTGKTVLAAAIISLLAANGMSVPAAGILEPTGIEDDMPEPQTAEEMIPGEDAENEEIEEVEKNGKIALICTGDVHGRAAAEPSEGEDGGVLGYDGAAALKQELVGQGYEVLMFDAGGSAQGSVLVNESRGAAAVEFMNAAGYDLMVPGNHELAWGADVLLDNAMMAIFPVISANIINEETEERLLEAYTVFELESGWKIGVFGLTTPQTVIRNKSDDAGGLTFLSAEALYACAQEQIDRLTEEECDLIVCVGHLGEDETAEPDRSWDVIANTEGIDVFIDGHSHRVIQEVEAETLLVSSGAYFENAGVVVWEPEQDRLESWIVTAQEYDKTDEKVSALIAEKQNLAEEELVSVIGTSEVELDGAGVRTTETNLGDLAADALLWQAEMIADEDIACAIVSAGAIRASVGRGDISRRMLLDVLPEEDYMTILTVSKEELQAVLETACGKLPAESDCFVQVSGMAFEVKTADDAEQSGSRQKVNTVGNVSIDGKALEDDAKYRIAIDDAILNGEGIGQILKDAYMETGYTTGVRLSDVLINFVTEHLDGVIGEEYKEPQGRIVIR